MTKCRTDGMCRQHQIKRDERTWRTWEMTLWKIFLYLPLPFCHTVFAMLLCYCIPDVSAHSHIPVRFTCIWHSARNSYVMIWADELIDSSNCLTVFTDLAVEVIDCLSFHLSNDRSQRDCSVTYLTSEHCWVHRILSYSCRHSSNSFVEYHAEGTAWRFNCISLGSSRRQQETQLPGQ